METFKTKQDFLQEKLKHPEIAYSIVYNQILEVLVDIRDVLKEMSNHMSYFENNKKAEWERKKARGIF